jgi:transcriptional regulator of met regulon
MAYAIRRLLLRTRTFRHRRARPPFTHHSCGTPAWQICRQFHPSTFRLNDKQNDRKPRRSRRNDAAKSKPEIQENGNDLDHSLQGLPAEGKAQSSASSESGVDFGASESQREFRKKVDELTKAGDLESLLDLANTESMTNRQRRELVQLVEKNIEVEEKAFQLQKLAKLVQERPDDIKGAKELMREIGMEPQDLFAPPNEEEAEAIRSDDKDVDLNDPEDIDRRFWASIGDRSESDEADWDQERIIRELMEDEQPSKISEKSRSKSGRVMDENFQRYLKRSVAERQRKIEKSFGVEGRNYDDDEEPEVPGFFNYEDDEAGEDQEFNQDDLPAKGHQELDLHREIREYARLAVWELPLLSSE